LGGNLILWEDFISRSCLTLWVSKYLWSAVFWGREHRYGDYIQDPVAHCLALSLYIHEHASRKTVTIERGFNWNCEGVWESQVVINKST